VARITFLYRSVPDQLDHYPVATRPYTSGLGREQVAYKPDQVVVELAQAWPGNFGDWDGRVYLICTGNPSQVKSSSNLIHISNVHANIKTIQKKYSSLNI